MNKTWNRSDRLKQKDLDNTSRNKQNIAKKMYSFHHLIDYFAWFFYLFLLTLSLQTFSTQNQKQCYWLVKDKI